MNDTMNRWVEVNGKTVSFGNMLGTFCGRPYCYECADIQGAAAFGKYLNRRDENGKTTAVTDEIRAKYHAKKIE